MTLKERVEVLEKAFVNLESHLNEHDGDIIEIESSVTDLETDAEILRDNLIVNKEKAKDGSTLKRELYEDFYAIGDWFKVGDDLCMLSQVGAGEYALIAIDGNRYNEPVHLGCLDPYKIPYYIIKEEFAGGAEVWSVGIDVIQRRKS